MFLSTRKQFSIFLLSLFLVHPISGTFNCPSGMFRKANVQSTHSETPLLTSNTNPDDMEGPITELNGDTYEPTRSLGDMQCGTGCVIVLIVGSFLLLSLVLMAVFRVYSRFTLKKDRDEFGGRETELRKALGASPGFPIFMYA